MKKTLLILCIALIWFPAVSQQVETTNKSQFTYCEIVGASRLMSSKVTVEIDFGQSRKLLSDNRYKDPETGKPFAFNSMIDALNFMGKQDWEFVQAYSTGDSQTGYVYHFLLKKETSLLEKELSDQGKAPQIN